MIITEKMENEINNKEKLVKDLHKNLDELTDMEINKSKRENEILNDPKIGDKIEGKLTEKAKTNYCNQQLEETNIKITWLKNDISKIKRDIELCNDLISLYKYMIRESEF